MPTGEWSVMVGLGGCGADMRVPWRLTAAQLPRIGLAPRRPMPSLPLQAVRPPNPVFDISYNVIYSPFPTWMMPLLAQLFWRSPLLDSIPMDVVLHPQRGPPFRAPGGMQPQLSCPSIDHSVPEVAYQQELQTQYNLTCTVSTTTVCGGLRA